ncbi:hypothetical protein [Streptomyces sp. NPDC000410]|uniref:hypothetical protein n=1 Tax=Streptomyces sp. NPDC000410 TaxID=3154254 RepID=UPI00332F3768
MDANTPVPPAAPPFPPPLPGEKPKRSRSPFKIIAGCIAVASLVATAVFTGLIYVQTPDTIEEIEQDNRLRTCVYAHEDPETWGEETDGLDCHELYGMPKEAWDSTYGIKAEEKEDSSSSSDDSSSSSDSGDDPLDY